MIDSAKEHPKLENFSRRARHLRITVGEESCLPTSSIPKMRKLHTLFIIIDAYNIDVQIEEFMSKLLSQCTCLRSLILDLSYSYFAIDGKVLVVIYKHMLLRFFKLSHYNIKEWPKTICELYNLQTLDIRNCFFLSGLPQGIEKLIDVRHLLYNHLHPLVGLLTSLGQFLYEFPTEVGAKEPDVFRVSQKK